MSYRHTSSASIALALAALLLAPVGSKAAPDVPTFAPAIWPEPAAADSFTRPRSALRIKPVQAGQPQPLFYAPSADSCSRAVRTHEEPGTQPAQLPRRIGSAALGAHAKYRARSADGAIALSAPAAPVAEAAELAAVAPAPAPAPAPIALIDSGVGRGKALQLAQEPVTAGMVDDNADFTQYLAFRDRTQVEHRPRDVRARVLLQVRDERGQAVPDAQVVVRASSGAAMWARTDAGGRAWIAPDAFDSQASQLYEVSVRQGQATAKAVFQRGQPSAVDVTLSAAAAALIFSAFPLPGALGLLLFNMSMPVTLYAARDILREGRATAFGLLTLGLFLGMLPAFSGASGSGQDYAMICLISIMLIRVGVGKR